jgi:hypothetical protein
MEESFELPELTADAEMQLSRADQEIARMAPALEKLQQRTADCWKKTQEKMQDSQRKIKEKTEKLRREFSGEWTEI